MELFNGAQFLLLCLILLNKRDGTLTLWKPEIKLWYTCKIFLYYYCYYYLQVFVERFKMRNGFTQTMTIIIVLLLSFLMSLEGFTFGTILKLFTCTFKFTFTCTFTFTFTCTCFKVMESGVFLQQTLTIKSDE